MTTRETPWPAGTPNWVDLSVPDIDAALAFYGSVLGWSFHDTGQDFGHYRLCQVGGRPVAGIGPRMSPEQPSAWLVHLASDDVDATAKLITENGGQLLAGPSDAGDFGRLAVAADSTGGVFGVFQANTSIGFEVTDEPGTLIWEEARLTNAEEGRRFYAAVFGYTYSEVPGMPLAEYAVFTIREGGHRPRGMGAIMGAPEGASSHWLAYFEVAEVDTAITEVRQGGGSAVQEARDTPFGRIGTVADPFGARLALRGPVTQQG